MADNRELQKAAPADLQKSAPRAAIATRVFLKKNDFSSDKKQSPHRQSSFHFCVFSTSTNN